MTTVEIDQMSWMRNQLERFTYRPGWRMSVCDGVPPMLVVDYEAVDSRDPQQCRRFVTHSQLHPDHCRDADSFTAAVQSIVEQLEIHESREWLRRDGVLVADPHADPNRWRCGCGTLGPVRRPDNTPWTCSGCGTVAGPEQTEESR